MGFNATNNNSGSNRDMVAFYNHCNFTNKNPGRSGEPIIIDVLGIRRTARVFAPQPWTITDGWTYLPAIAGIIFLGGTESHDIRHGSCRAQDILRNRWYTTWHMDCANMMKVYENSQNEVECLVEGKCFDSKWLVVFDPSLFWNLQPTHSTWIYGCD